jgi:hypothetical protein
VLRPRLYRTTTFRLALLYAGLFSLSVVALFGIVYWSADRIDRADRHDIIENDLAELIVVRQCAVLSVLVEVVLERTAPSAGGGLYLLADREFVPIAGNVRAWPIEGEIDGPWMKFRLAREEFGDPAPHWAEAKLITLDDGFHLLVGRNIQSQFQSAIANCAGSRPSTMPPTASCRAR